MVKKFSSRDIAYLGVLSALIILFQSLSSFGFLKVGAIEINLSLVPIFIGVIFVGFWGGIILGFVSATVIMIYALAGFNPFTLALLQYSPAMAVLTVVVVYGKGCLAPIVSFLVYRSLKGKNDKFAVYLSSVLCPIVNTGVFCLAMLLFGKNFLYNTYDIFKDKNILYVVFIGLAGLNALIELFINLVLSPAVYHVEKVYGGTPSGENSKIRWSDKVDPVLAYLLIGGEVVLAFIILFSLI